MQFLLAAAHPRDGRVGDWEEDDFEQGLPQEADDHVVDELTWRFDADDCRCDGAEQEGVGELADDGGADEACPQAVVPEPVLHFLQHPRVEQLACDVACQGSHDDAWHEAEDRREGFLHVVEVGAGEPDGDVEGYDGQDGDAEPGEDCPAGGFESVDFGEHVAEDVCKWEEEEGAVGDEWSEGDSLLCCDVGNEEDGAEHRYQYRVKRSRNSFLVCHGYISYTHECWTVCTFSEWGSSFW